MGPLNTGSFLQHAALFATPLCMTIAVPVLLVAYIIVNSIYNVYFHPLAKFPGPFWAKITRLWITWQCYKGREPYVLQELSKKYGTLRYSCVIGANSLTREFSCRARCENYSRTLAR